jgi:putative intracellular protease/amidase
MVLFLLPDADYDPTESSVPWQALRRAGIEMRFATPRWPAPTTFCLDHAFISAIRPLSRNGGLWCVTAIC